MSTINSFKNNVMNEQEILAVLERFVEIREEVQIHDLCQDSKELETVFYMLTKEFFRFKPSRSLFYKELQYDYEREKSSWRPFFFIGLFENFMCNTNELEINEIFNKDLGFFHEFFYKLILVDISERHYESHTLLWYFDCEMWSVLGKEFSKFLKGKIQKCAENDDIELFLKIYKNFFDALETEDLLELFSFDGINIVPFLLKNISTEDYFKINEGFDSFLKEKNTELPDCISNTLLYLLPDYIIENECNDPLYLLGFFDCLTKEHVQQLIKNPKVDFFELLMKYLLTDGPDNDEILKKIIVEKEIDFCQLCHEVIKEKDFEKIFWFWDRWLLEILTINDLKKLLEDPEINFVESLLKAVFLFKYKDEVGLYYHFPSKLKHNSNLRSLMVKQITQVIKKYEKESFVPLLAIRLLDFFSAQELFNLLKDDEIKALTKINQTIDLHYHEIGDLNESFYRWKINFLKFLMKFNFPVSEQIDRVEPLENLVMSLAPFDEEVEESHDFFDYNAELNGPQESVSIAGRKIILRNGVLDLSGLNIYDLEEVEGLFELKTIKVLSLSNNFIKELPAKMGNLTSLEQLLIENCTLTSIPESIGNLANVKKINLESTNLNFLPESFGNLLRLEILNISFNNLNQLPKSFKNLVNLKDLNLRHNKLIDISGWLGDLKNLRKLNLMSNRLFSKIPESIGNLTSLRELNLWGTWVSTLPQTISNLKKLKELNLYGTHFREIPDSFGNLSSLEYLSCDPGSSSRDIIIKVPESILNCKSLKTLRLNRETLENRSPIIEELIRRGVDVSS